MKRGPAKSNALLGLLFVFILARQGEAVLFESTGDPSYNTNAPTGSLTNSGWQYEGQWGVYLGTPIAPTFFLAAQHIGGSPGDPFVFNGFTYTTVTNFDDPSSDLRIWQVAETFPSYAPLYTASNEVSNLCVVFGRGTRRGAPFIMSGVTNGWLWGASDGVERWGENTIVGVALDTGMRQYLAAYFDGNGITNECDLSVGDSSGGMFIENGTTWELAGIHYAVDGPFSVDGSTTDEFDAAVFDVYGLYECNETDCVLQTNNVPSAFYSTRVSARIPWIDSVINYNLGNDLGIAGVQIVEGYAQISLMTGSNRVYRVDYTTNFVNAIWTTLTNNVAGTGGIVTVIDRGAAGQPQRFYRATILQ